MHKLGGRSRDQKKFPLLITVVYYQNRIPLRSRGLNKANGIVGRIPTRTHISVSYVRNRPGNLLNLCPRFRGTCAPVLFHLPDRTLDRLLETFPPDLVAPAFVENSSVLYGMDRQAMALRLPRWKTTSNRRPAVQIASRLGQYIVSNPGSISEEQMLDVIDLAASLFKNEIISAELATRIIHQVLPLCLEKTSLCREDLLRLVIAVRTLPATLENSVLFPMLANFGSWFMERNLANRIQRCRKKREEIKVASRLSLGETSYKQIFS